MGLSLGDPVSVVSPLGEVSPLGRVPKMRPFRLAGTFESGMFEYDSSIAFVSLAQAQSFLAMPGRVTGLEVKTRDIYEGGPDRQRHQDPFGVPLLDQGLDAYEQEPLFGPEARKDWSCSLF